MREGRKGGREVGAGERKKKRQKRDITKAKKKKRDVRKESWLFYRERHRTICLRRRERESDKGRERKKGEERKRFVFLFFVFLS